MVYPAMIPSKGPDNPSTARERDGRLERSGPSQIGGSASTAAIALKAEQYRPTIFGFQIHEVAKLQRWQEATRDRYGLLPSCIRS